MFGSEPIILGSLAKVINWLICLIKKASSLWIQFQKISDRVQGRCWRWRERGGGEKEKEMGLVFL